MGTITKCPVCGGDRFALNEVLWQELVSDWELSLHEIEYINRQQGFHCQACGNNLRSMALATAIVNSCKFVGTLAEFVVSDEAKLLSVLEINEAGGLTSLLQTIPNHQLIKYPEFDMSNLPFSKERFDLVLHSDTLEHVSDPVDGLAECRRVLKEGGRCLFTVPVIFGRMSRDRAGLKNSFHGTEQMSAGDYVVCTEFGADVWRYVFEAGFLATKIHGFDYPAGLAIEASMK